jgi:hypothetical protein
MRKRRHATKQNPLPEAAIIWGLWGVAAVGAAAVVYYWNAGSASGATGSTGSTGATGSGTVTLPAQTITGTAPPGGSTSTAKMNFAATEANNGAQYSMHVGDTLTVTLDVPSGASTFQDAQVVGSSLTPGSAAELGTQTLQVFTASSTGNETISYQAVDANNNPVGNMLSFSAIVT